MLDLIRMIGAKGGSPGMLLDEYVASKPKAKAKPKYIDQAAARRASLAIGRQKRAREAHARIVNAIREIGSPSPISGISKVAGRSTGSVSTTIKNTPGVYGVPVINRMGRLATYWWLKGEPIPEGWSPNKRVGRRGPSVSAQTEARIIKALRVIGHPAPSIEIANASGLQKGWITYLLREIPSICRIAGINARWCKATYWWIKDEPIPEGWSADKRRNIGGEQ